MEPLIWVPLIIMALSYLATLGVSFIFIRKDPAQRTGGGIAVKKTSTILFVGWLILLLPVAILSLYILTAEYAIPVARANMLYIHMLLLLATLTPIFALFCIIASFFYRRKGRFALAATMLLSPISGVVTQFAFVFWYQVF